MPAPVGKPSRPPLAARIVKAALVAFMVAMLTGTVWGVGGSLVDAGQDLRYGLASREWTGTVGVIDTSHVSQGRTPTPSIAYHYEVGGRVIRSERIGTRTAYADGFAVAAAYPPGSEVLVYHDPSGEVAVLERGIGAYDVVRFAVLCLAAVVLTLFYVALLHLVATTPAVEHLAQWRVLLRMGYRRARADPDEMERQVRADLAVEAEIAERLREQAARRAKE